MTEVLSRLSNDGAHCLPENVRVCLKGIVELFLQFRGAKLESGDAWEALFIIVLIVRCMTGSFLDAVVPLSGSLVTKTEVWYNAPFSLQFDFGTKDPLEFLQGIGLEGESRISIYYPPHARFATYDVILAYWDSQGRRFLYGYQLKEGKLYSKPWAMNQQFNGSFLIKGVAPFETGNSKLWQIVSDQNLDAFFGESGAQWGPKNWKKLEEEGIRGFNPPGRGDSRGPHKTLI